MTVFSFPSIRANFCWPRGADSGRFMSRDGQLIPGLQINDGSYQTREDLLMLQFALPHIIAAFDAWVVAEELRHGRVSR